MKKIILTVMALLLSSTLLVSTAVAGQSSQLIKPQVSYSVSYGDHGYTWSHFELAPYSKNYSYSYDIRISQLEKMLHKNRNIKLHRHWGYDRHSERYFYVDSNGVNRYFHLNPHKDYAVHQYKDKNGTTQFWFKSTGWK